MAEATKETRTGSGEQGELKQQLKMRHMTMISLGGVIGAGLFVGSGAVIASVGPAAVVSYLMAGLILVLVMRMLGEMATARPAAGSFAEYSRMALGDWAGFAVGWLYAYFWIIVVAVEAQAGALILNAFFPAIPQWSLALVLMLLLTATNMVSVGSFGEFEFWFASIKVVAIIGFLILGGLFLFGLWPGVTMDFSNLTQNGGFAPNGYLAMFSGIVTVIFSFVGAEIVTIAAAESEEPERGVARATTSVIWRVLIFYVGSIFIVVTLLPWNGDSILPSEGSESRGPYVAVLELLQIPGAAFIMSLIVLTAVLSCLNSGLYTASRMLNALAKRGDAPKSFLDVNSRGVPAKAILLCTSVGFLSVVMAIYFPETVFLFLLNTSGAIALFVYLLIAISELRLRRTIERETPERLTLKMWLYPYLTIFTIMAFVAVICSMFFIESTRSQLLLSLLSVGILMVAYLIRRRNGSPGDATNGR